MKKRKDENVKMKIGDHGKKTPHAAFYHCISDFCLKKQYRDTQPNLTPIYSLKKKKKKDEVSVKSVFFHFIDERSNFLLDFIKFYITWNKTGQGQFKAGPIQILQREAKREETVRKTENSLLLL